MPRAPRFLLDEKLSSPGVYALNRQESHHAATVLRLRVGDEAVLFDGSGNYGEAIIELVDRDVVRARIDEVRTEPHLPLMVTLATAIPKGKRWQALVEKCTELGVDRIIPIHTGQSVAKGEGDPEKWRRWMVEAAKQSRRARIPEIVEPCSVQEALALAKRENSLLFVADPQGRSLRSHGEDLSHVVRVMALIGPEGGFTGEESALFKHYGARPVKLSSYILRVETAAAVICALIRDAVE